MKYQCQICKANMDDYPRENRVKDKCHFCWKEYIICSDCEENVNKCPHCNSVLYVPDSNIGGVYGDKDHQL